MPMHPTEQDFKSFSVNKTFEFQQNVYCVIFCGFHFLISQHNNLLWGKRKHTKYGHFLQIASVLAIFTDHKITSPPHVLIYSSFLKYSFVDWAVQFKFSWVKCAWHMIVTSVLSLSLSLYIYIYIYIYIYRYKVIWYAQISVNIWNYTCPRTVLCFIAILCIRFNLLGASEAINRLWTNQFVRQQTTIQYNRERTVGTVSIWRCRLSAKNMSTKLCMQ